MIAKYRRITIEIVVGILLIASFYFLLSARKKSIWPRDRVVADTGHRQIMGTFARIVAVAMDQNTAEKCAEAAFNELHIVDNLMSHYKADSEISKVNRTAHKEAVKVSRPVFDLLQKAIEFSAQTDGAFDITVGPLVDIWRLAEQKNSTPTEAELAEAAAKVGYEKLILDAQSRTVRFAADGMHLDLGAIAKGYAVDLATEAMQKAGAIGGLVDVGGDIRVFGYPPRQKNVWVIGVQDPARASETIVPSLSILTLKLINAAVATSGSYYRFTLIDDKKQSHIIDTSTGTGIKAVSSVTIISTNTTDADALATAVSVMGPEKGLALIETIPDTEAILILPGPEFKQLQTSGAQKYIKKQLANP